MKKINYLLIMLALGLITACGIFNTQKFDETESGLQYRFHVSTGDEKPEPGDILSLNMVYSIEDSVLFDNMLTGVPVYLPFIEPQYPGDIFEAISMLSIGDSATFKLDAADFYLYTAGMMEMPGFVKENSKLSFHIKLLQSMNEAEFAAEEQRMMEEQLAQDMLRSEHEEDLRLEYLAAEGITDAPTASGLYFIEKKRGDGPKVIAGNRVKVHYEGRLLDGTVFDSSYERGDPIDFVIGQGWVIPGWDEGITMMHVGGKATLVIPSHLGYGERGAGPTIPAFSTLVFDVEVVEAKNPN